VRERMIGLLKKLRRRGVSGSLPRSTTSKRTVPRTGRSLSEQTDAAWFRGTLSVIATSGALDAEFLERPSEGVANSNGGLGAVDGIRSAVGTSVRVQLRA
jgi:hypothetical protein